MKTKLLIGGGIFVFVILIGGSIAIIMAKKNASMQPQTTSSVNSKTTSQAETQEPAKSPFAKFLNKAADTVDNKDPVIGTTDLVKDAQRQAHISEMNTALKLALNDKEVKLVSTTGCTTCTSATGTTALDGKTGWIKFEVLSGKTGLSTYIKELRIDPENTGDYVYTYASNGSSFELNAVLKRDTNIVKMENDKGNNPSKYEIGTNLTIIN